MNAALLGGRSVIARAVRAMLVATTIAASVASCGLDNELPGVGQNWTLLNINGDTLPYTVHTASHVVIVTSGTAQLNSNNNYSFVYLGTTDGVAGTVGLDNGGWTIMNGAFTFTSSTLHGESYSGGLNPPNFSAQIPPEIFNSINGFVNVEFTKN